MSMTATASQPMMKGTSDRSSALAWNHRALGKPVAVSLLLHATVFASVFAWWHAQGAPAPRGLPDGFSVTFIELSDPSPAPAAPQVPQEMQAAPVEPQPQIEPEPIVEPAVPVKPEVALEARPEPRPEPRAALVKPAAPQQTASLAPTLATGTGQGAPKGIEKTNGQQGGRNSRPQSALSRQAAPARRYPRSRPFPQSGRHRQGPHQARSQGRSDGRRRARELGLCAARPRRAHGRPQMALRAGDPQRAACHRLRRNARRVRSHRLQMIGAPANNGR